MKEAYEDVHAFHSAFDIPIRDLPGFPDQDREALRMNLIEEEFRELKEAISARDIVAIADACADLKYVILGFEIEYGIPAPEVWSEVHRSNMAKVDPETGKVRKRADGKILKPEGWLPPNIAGIIAQAGKDSDLRDNSRRDYDHG